MPNCLVQRTEAQGGEILAHFFGEKLEERLHELGLAGEAFAKLRVLSRNPHRTGVQVTHPHQDAAADDHRGGRKTKLLRSEQRRDDHIATGLHLAINLKGDASTQVIAHESLLSFRKPDLPGSSRVLQGVQGARTRSAVVPRNQNHVSFRFRHSGGDRSNSGLAHEFHVDASARVRALQVKNQLLEVLNGVNVVVRRW